MSVVGVTNPERRWGDKGTLYEGKNKNPAASNKDILGGKGLMMQGHNGSDVSFLQQQLVDLGYLKSSEIDGIFGPKTKNAVEKLQRVNGLKVDGIVGKQTQAYLNDPTQLKRNPEEKKRIEEAFLNRVNEYGANPEQSWADAARKGVKARGERARQGRKLISSVLHDINNDKNLPAAQKKQFRAKAESLNRLYDRLSGSYFAGTKLRREARQAAELEESILARAQAKNDKN